LNVVQNDDKLKATLVTPAQPVDSIIPASRLTPASDKDTGLVTVPLGDKGGGKVHCILKFRYGYCEILLFLV
jgi:hypothetical protein